MAAAAQEVLGDPTLFAIDMRKVINDSEMSDIQFVVGEDREKISAHKIILAARCEVFRAMFAEQRHSKAKTTKDGQQTLLVLPDVRPTVFLTVLEFIYTNGCKLSQSTVVDVLASAIEYGLEGLVLCCVSYITAGLEVDTACEAIQAAITYKQDDLRDSCMEFIERHTKDIFKSPHFAELSDETLAFILQSDNLQADETEIFAAVTEWGTINMVVSDMQMAQVIEKVIQHVRFPLLSTEMLTRIEADNEKNPIVPVHLISKAWRFHATKTADKSDPSFRRRAGTH
eukprot:m.94652 g.94652  ORF g.94652 m.94652 type:complete len:285 (+) comp16556_c0_seq1:266-1120(+)